METDKKNLDLLLYPHQTFSFAQWFIKITEAAGNIDKLRQYFPAALWDDSL